MNDEALRTAQTVAGSIEDLTRLLEYTKTVEGTPEEDKATLEAVKQLRGILYGLDKLEDELLAD